MKVICCTSQVEIQVPDLDNQKITKSQHRVSLLDSTAFMQLFYDFQQTLMYETGGHLSVS